MRMVHGLRIAFNMYLANRWYKTEKALCIKSLSIIMISLDGVWLCTENAFDLGVFVEQIINYKTYFLFLHTKYS